MQFCMECGHARKVHSRMAPHVCRWDDCQCSGVLTTITDREQQVMALLCCGKTNKEIATEFDLTVQTIEAHRAGIFSKLELHSLAELIIFALRNELIKLEDMPACGVRFKRVAGNRSGLRGRFLVPPTIAS